MASHLLQETVLRAAHQTGKSEAPPPPHHSSSPNDSDNDSTMTGVHTPACLTSPNGTPGSSRPPSPNQAHQSRSTPNQSRAQSRVGVRAKRQAAAAKAKASSLDPLVRLPNPVRIRIFELVGLDADGAGGRGGDIFHGVRNLMTCGLVCRKWRKSATINFIWFKLYSSAGYNPTLEMTFVPPTWSRKDSEIEWATRYRLKHKVDRPQPPAPIYRESDVPNTHELKHQQWEEEDNTPASPFKDKTEAREFFKARGGRKLKDKTGRNWGTAGKNWKPRDDLEDS